MFRAKGTSISLRDLRIAKLQKRMRITACGPELDTFLAAVAAASGNEDKVPEFVKKALSNCMEESVRSLHLLFNCCFCCRTRSHCTCIFTLSSHKNQREKLKGASVAFHVAKHVKRK